MAVYLGDKLVDVIYRISKFEDLPKYFSETLGSTLYAEDLQGLRTIKDYGFYTQEKITRVILPETLTKIGKNAFSSKVTSIRFLSSTPPEITTSSLPTGTSRIIYVPAGSLETYKAAPNWSRHTNQLREW